MSSIATRRQVTLLAHFWRWAHSLASNLTRRQHPNPIPYMYTPRAQTIAHLTTWHDAPVQLPSFAAVNASSYGMQQFWATNFNTIPSSMIVLFEQMVVNNWFALALRYKIPHTHTHTHTHIYICISACLPRVELVAAVGQRVLIPCRCTLLGRW